LPLDKSQFPLKRLRWERFAIIQATGSATSQGEAYEQAGYPPSKNREQLGSKLALKPEVKGRILFLKTQRANESVEKAVITDTWVDEKVIEIVMRCMQAVAVKDKLGNETGEWRFDPRSALKGLELLGMDLGKFVRKAEVKTGTIDPFEGKSDDDLVRFIAGVTRELGPGVLEAIAREQGFTIARIPGESSKSGEDAEAGAREPDQVLPSLPETGRASSSRSLPSGEVPAWSEPEREDSVRWSRD